MFSRTLMLPRIMFPLLALEVVTWLGWLMHRAGMKCKGPAVSRARARTEPQSWGSLRFLSEGLHPREPHSFGYVDSFERPIARRGRGARSDRWRPS